EFGRNELHGPLQNLDRLRQPVEVDAFHLSVLIFEMESGHLPFGAPVENVDLVGAQSSSSVGRVDSSVPTADHHHNAAYFDIVGRFVVRDKLQRIDNLRPVFSRNTQPLHGAQAGSDEDQVEFVFQIFQRNAASDIDLAEFDSHGFDHGYFTQAIG